MNNYIVESVDIDADASLAFQYISDPARLPEWTNAFKSVEGTSAFMETPAGRADIELAVFSSPEHGVIDWKMTFPDGSVSWARSRVLPMGDDRCVYSFVLPLPPAELEKLEGTLEEQGQLLRQELRRLQSLLERQ
jgi:hypothetical protein